MLQDRDDLEDSRSVSGVGSRQKVCWRFGGCTVAQLTGTLKEKRGEKCPCSVLGKQNLSELGNGRSLWHRIGSIMKVFIWNMLKSIPVFEAMDSSIPFSEESGVVKWRVDGGL